MSDLYNRIHDLCLEMHISDTDACKAVHMSRSTLSNLKNGHAQTLGADKLQAFSDFFSGGLNRKISVEYLIGKEQTQTQTIDNLANSVNIAMYDGDSYNEVPDDIKNLAAAFALAKKEQDIKDPALRKIVDICKKNPEYVQPLSIMLDQLIQTAERKGGANK